jgi:hypothetical protein
VTSGLIAAFVSLIATGVAAWVAIESTRTSVGEDREKEGREARARIYPDFLAAVDAREAAADGYQLSSARAVVSQCDGQRLQQRSRAQYEAADSEYRKQRNLLYVYGSDEAWNAAEAVDRFQPQPDGAVALIVKFGNVRPPNCSSDSQRLRQTGWGEYRWSRIFDAPKEAELQRVRPRNSQEAYLAAYKGFQAVFCREVSAVPRSGCGR